MFMHVRFREVSVGIVSLRWGLKVLLNIVQIMSPLSTPINHNKYTYLSLNSQPASGIFCRLQIVFCEQFRHNVGPDLDSNSLTDDITERSFREKK